MLTITIPGEPIGQGRARFSRRSGVAYDPAKSRNWKATAQAHMLAQMNGAPPLQGPLIVDVVAVFTLARSHWRKREPVPSQPHESAPDWDNVGKIVGDAGNGVLWLDDRQIYRGTVEKRVGAQGEAPSVTVTVREYTRRPIAAVVAREMAERKGA
jgi:Holliday junction resolvase RusA-like endonuclease